MKAGFLILAACSVLYAQDSLEKELVAMERQFFTAWQNKSIEAVEKNIAPEGVSWSEHGIFDKAAQIANQAGANRNCTVKSFELKDVRVLPLTENSAMLLYTVNQHAACGSANAPTPVCE